MRSRHAGDGLRRALLPPLPSNQKSTTLLGVVGDRFSTGCGKGRQGPGLRSEARTLSFGPKAEGRPSRLRRHFPAGLPGVTCGHHAHGLCGPRGHAHRRAGQFWQWRSLRAWSRIPLPLDGRESASPVWAPGAGVDFARAAVLSSARFVRAISISSPNWTKSLASGIDHGRSTAQTARIDEDPHVQGPP